MINHKFSVGDRVRFFHLTRLKARSEYVGEVVFVYICPRDYQYQVQIESSDKILEVTCCFVKLISKACEVRVFALFHKKCAIRRHSCRLTLIRSELESAELGTSNGGSDLQIRFFGADLVAEFPQILDIFTITAKNKH